MSLEEPVAQPVEHLTFNQGVLGSSPSGLTILDAAVEPPTLRAGGAPSALRREPGLSMRRRLG